MLAVENVIFRQTSWLQVDHCKGEGCYNTIIVLCSFLGFIRGDFVTYRRGRKKENYRDCSVYTDFRLSLVSICYLRPRASRKAAEGQLNSRPLQLHAIFQPTSPFLLVLLHSTE